MNSVMTTLLLIEDDPVEARQIQEALAGTTGTLFRFEWAKTLADALDRLGHGGIEIVLLDLTLSGGQGVAAFDRVFQAAPDALILVLGAASDEETARQAIQRGAHDYLSKGHVDAHWLPRALRYLIERKLAIDALRSSEARFRAISDASPLGIFVSNAQGLCAYSNLAYHKIAGQSLEQTLGTQWGDALHPEDRARVLEEWQLALRDQTPFQSEARFLREDASIVWARLNDAAMIDERAVLGRVLTVEDISERKAEELALRRAEDALFEEKERAQVTLNSIGDAVLCTDLQGRVSYLNQIAETMTGWPLEEARGRPLAEVFQIINSTTRQIAENPALRTIEENKTLGLAADCALIRRDGLESAIEDSIAPIHNREGRVTGAVIVFHDVSESRAMALRMSHLAQHDFLTGLPNRVLLTERLSQAVRLALRHHKQGALLFLDLDDFKQINDSLGHAVGDQLLKQVAERLSACVRTTDTVCRQGGDEFVILLAEIEQAQDAARVAENVLKALAAPHLIDGHELHVTVSIGISIYPDDGVSVDNVIQNADTAMYHAKASGRNSHEFFRTDMNLRSVQRLFLEGRLHRALKNGEFLLYYQPQMDIVSGAMTGAEALIRWMDPDLGLILPAQFVPVAEECGLITQIGYWVLHEACRQVRAWQASGLEAVPVAVNVSAIEFRQKGFLEGLALILRETGLSPHLLELELTESVLMHDAESSVAILESLKTMGVELAIDDFGTGYSSLSYLKRFPIGTLKIDRSFVHDIDADGNGDDAAIANAVIGMGRSLKQRVIAEGVETPEQLAFLRDRHCDEAQGYLFSRPLPAQDFANLLASVKH